MISTSRGMALKGGLPTFAEAELSGKVAPIAGIRGTAMEPPGSTPIPVIEGGRHNRDEAQGAVHVKLVASVGSPLPL